MGLFHYRRFLDLTDDDLLHMKNENVDVVLPYPTVHEPDIREHHSRYIAESDWDAMLQALRELKREYAKERIENGALVILHQLKEMTRTVK